MEYLTKQNGASPSEETSYHKVSISSEASKSGLALGHGNDDLEKTEISTESRTVGWSSSLVRTLALRAKGRRFKSGSAHLFLLFIPVMNICMYV